ncbi:hypothetical protein RAMLITH_01675 [Ramlibacter sp. RBP-2]|uniref:Uncharacterized protein n=1 Tax=Ramlibacter lithotrophicus TaxID=2606681 RepID=A0A7X6DCC3_9BURK|nr:hypothetical protein [Ramlibacter lithotrophicus]NKE64516.1 hypothetical protein [Ramlibacter lithotrophicus]
MRAKLTLLARLVDLRDLLAFGGLAMIGYGLALVYVPLAWVAVGAVLFWLGAGSVTLPPPTR